MADFKKKREKPAFDFGAEKSCLEKNGPDRVYFLWGEEDYLRDAFLELLRAQCAEEGTEAFNLHRLNWADTDMSGLAECVDAMPFMGERTFTVIRDFEPNQIKEKGLDSLKIILSDVPEWATVAFVLRKGYEPDGRLGCVKYLRKAAHEIEFYAPSQAVLQNWIVRETKKLGKSMEKETANYLLWVCGNGMTNLIGEITKVAGYAAGDAVTRADIDAVAKKAPETTVFDLTDELGARHFDRAATLLADLLADKDEPPQKQIAMISEQYRRLYVAAVALEKHKGDDFVLDCIPEIGKNDYRIRKLKESAKNYGLDRLARAVSMCAECDFGMRSDGPAPEDRMKELILHLAMDR